MSVLLLLRSVSVSSGISIFLLLGGSGAGNPVGQTSETDLAQSLTSAKYVAVGQVTETDLSQPITYLPPGAVFQIEEIDLAQSISPFRFISTGQPSETDLAQPIAVITTHFVFQTTETDLAQSFTVTKFRTLNQPSETDVALALIPYINPANETDLAQTISPTRFTAVGQATETDLAQSSFIHNKFKAVGQSLEVDLSETHIPLKSKVLLQPSEVSTAFSLGTVELRLPGQVNETDLARPIVIVRSRNYVTETDIAFTITPILISPPLPNMANFYDPIWV